MPVPFTNIALLFTNENPDGTAAYAEYSVNSRMANYVSDLYGRCMQGYKPPYCSRIVIHLNNQVGTARQSKTGSVVMMGLSYHPNEFAQLDTFGKYRWLLNIIQECLLELSITYYWSKKVFEKAFQLVLDKHFIFRFDFPPVLSKNRKMSAVLSIEKTERTTVVYAAITSDNNSVKIKLYEKVNSFWFDCSYILMHFARWYDDDRFGIDYSAKQISIWYSRTAHSVHCFDNGLPVEQLDFKKHFWMQLD